MHGRKAGWIRVFRRESDFHNYPNGRFATNFRENSKFSVCETSISVMEFSAHTGPISICSRDPSHSICRVPYLCAAMQTDDFTIVTPCRNATITTRTGRLQHSGKPLSGVGLCQIGTQETDCHKLPTRRITQSFVHLLRRPSSPCRDQPVWQDTNLCRHA